MTGAHSPHATGKATRKHTIAQFDWRLQTRPFQIPHPGTYRYYRVDFDGTGNALAEVELLGRPAN
jgi:hypothetical protein